MKIKREGFLETKEGEKLQTAVPALRFWKSFCCLITKTPLRVSVSVTKVQEDKWILSSVNARQEADHRLLKDSRTHDLSRTGGRYCLFFTTSWCLWGWFGGSSYCLVGLNMFSLGSSCSRGPRPKHSRLQTCSCCRSPCCRRSRFLRPNLLSEHQFGAPTEERDQTGKTQSDVMTVH